MKEKLSNYIDMYKLSGDRRRPLSDGGEMRNESDDDMSTVSKGDIFSSSEEDDSEISEEMSDSDEDENADPWGILIHEAVSLVRVEYDELVESFKNDGNSEIDAKKQAFSEILPKLQKELGNVYLRRLEWIWDMKKDPVHRKIMETRKRFVEDESFGPDEALAAAVKKRKFLLKRMLEDRQVYNDDDDDDDDEDDID